jgi:hypothetical protein
MILRRVCVFGFENKVFSKTLPNEAYLFWKIVVSKTKFSKIFSKVS